jgi:hypothetical protein
MRGESGIRGQVSGNRISTFEVGVAENREYSPLDRRLALESDSSLTGLNHRKPLPMRSFSFAASAVLAGLGVLVALFGVIAEEGKSIGAGLIMILGAGVFAILYGGGQLPPRRMAHSEPTHEREL